MTCFLDASFIDCLEMSHFALCIVYYDLLYMVYFLLLTGYFGSCILCSTLYLYYFIIGNYVHMDDQKHNAESQYPIWPGFNPPTQTGAFASSYTIKSNFQVRLD